MGLSIKNPRSEGLVRELAALRGVSLVTAVIQAVVNEIQRENESQRKRKIMADWLMEISRETGPMMNDSKTSKEVMDELYDDEAGLPK